MTTMQAAPMTMSTGLYHPEMALARLAPSKTNPRTHFHADKLAELARSLQEHGVLEPLIVRARNGSGSGFEIVAGERRFRAATLAQLVTVPVIERTLTDEQVLEIQLIENIQRDDLTALEQARGYRALIESNPKKYTAVAIATRVGMSEAWVWDRLKLNDLIPEAKALLEQDRMATGHAVLIARQKPADQTRIIDPAGSQNGGRAALWQYEHVDDGGVEARGPVEKYAHMKPVSVRELEQWIAEHIRFDVTHAAKALPAVFASTATAVAEAAAQPGRGRKVISITFEYRVADDARDTDERTYGSQSWRRADGQEKSKTCEHSVLGVVVAGSEQYGKAFEVCVDREKCRVHFGDVIRQREKTAKANASGSAKKRTAAAVQHEARQKREAAQKVKDREAETRYRALKPLVLKATLAVAEKVKTPTRAQFQAIVKVFGLPKGTTPATLQQALLLEAVKRSFHEAYFWADKNQAKLRAWPTLLGVDLKACEPKAAALDVKADR